MNPPLRSLPLLLPLLVSMYVPFLGGGFLLDDFVHLDHLADVSSIATIVATPDAFGFYRPVTQASLKVDTILFGRNATGFRVVNLALHAGVIGAAFLVARLALMQPLAALLATIAFALTPKAHPIAVLWISGRAELLMALFSFLAVAAWIVWSRNGRALWLAGAIAAYLLALLSKETAFLLPLLFLATPFATRPWRVGLIAVSMLLGVAAVTFVWRSSIGALTPFSGHEHYTLAASPARWLRSARNYAGRMAPSPAALVVLVGSAGFLAARRRTAVRVLGRFAVSISVFSLAWILVFLTPVMPLVARSELYLYLPVFGACVLAGSVTQLLIHGIERHRAVLTAIAFVVIGLSVYQASRSLELNRDLDFSAKFVSALEGHRDLAGQQIPVAVVPGDAITERFLKDAIDWTLPAVLQHALRNEHPTGVVEYAGVPVTPNAIRLVCEYRDGIVTLRRQP